MTWKPKPSDEQWWQEEIMAFGWPEEGPRGAGTVEALYQHFKARLLAELLVDVHGAPNFGRLVSREQASVK